jgi:O-antigen/teichoic acid export membrane protein
VRDEARATSVESLTSGAVLARSGALNAVGTLLPPLAGLVAVPLLLDGMGTARVGLLSLAWALVGYLSIIDLGLGRALTQAVAAALAKGERAELRQLVWTYLSLLTILGAVACGVMLVVGPWLMTTVVSSPDALRREIVLSTYLLALTTPLVMIGAGLRGFLEAHQRFDLVTFVRLPTTTLMFFGPVLLLSFTNSLVAAVAVLLTMRLVAAVAYYILCVRLVPDLREWARPDSRTAFLLARMGGWITVSNVVGPVIVYIDRFVVGAVVSATAIAYYGIPADAVTRLSLIPLALVPVMFPAFASLTLRDPRLSLLVQRGTRLVLLAMLAPAAIGVAFAPDLLNLWLGPEFADKSALVAQLLLLGVVANGIAQVPLALLQGTGRPDVAAKLHLVELPLFVLGAWLATRLAGIQGAAIASATRALLDAALLFLLGCRLFPNGLRSLPVQTLLTSIAVLVVAAMLPAVLMTTIIRVSLGIVAASVLVVWIWGRGLDDAERKLILGAIRPSRA